MTTTECSVCQQRFKLNIQLNIHMKHHAAILHFQCEVCEKWFRTKGNMQQHIRIHTKEKPYECLICEKRFTQLSHLQTHRHVHQVKRFSCHFCKKTFIQRTSLEGHFLRIHKQGVQRSGKPGKSWISRSYSIPGNNQGFFINQIYF